MRNQIRSIIKQLVPRTIINILIKLRKVFLTLQLPETKRIFKNAEGLPSYLDIDLLEILQHKYPFPAEYGYDEKSVLTRGKLRANQILSLPGAQNCSSFLELGCWDGMVSYALSRMDKEATAIDISTEGFDKRAIEGSVQLIQMDAGEMKFEDESFDFIFSFDTFEHFSQPEKVLQEIIRVLKTDGYLYLQFEPLYMAPFGEHAYRSITVPYCQFLFPKNAINEFAIKKGLTPIDFNHVNRWRIENFRNLWEKYKSNLSCIKYSEGKNLRHLNLIRKYPSCFKSKTNNFDDLIISSIEVLFQKLK